MTMQVESRSNRSGAAHASLFKKKPEVEMCPAFRRALRVESRKNKRDAEIAEHRDAADGRILKLVTPLYKNQLGDMHQCIKNCTDEITAIFHPVLHVGENGFLLDRAQALVNKSAAMHTSELQHCRGPSRSYKLITKALAQQLGRIVQEAKAMIKNRSQ